MQFHSPLHWRHSWPVLLHSLHGVWEQRPLWRLGLSAAAYGLVVTLMALAALLISTDMPFPGMPAVH